MAEVLDYTVFNDFRDFATSYRSNPRNIENPWYPAYHTKLVALAPAGNNFALRLQQEIPSPDQIFDPNDTKSCQRGFLFPDLDIVRYEPRQGEQPSQAHINYKSLIELKKNIPRKYLLDLLSLNTTGKEQILITLKKAIEQVERQATFVYAREGVNIQGQMVLMAGVGPFWTYSLAQRSDFGRVDRAEDVPEDQYTWATPDNGDRLEEWEAAMEELENELAYAQSVFEDPSDRYEVDWETLSLFAIPSEDLRRATRSELDWNTVYVLGSAESDDAIRTMYEIMETL